MTETQTYTIPLRRDYRSKPKYKRAKRAIKTIHVFTAKHMNTDEDNVRLSPHLNEVIWQNGARNPPGKVKVMMHERDDIVHVVHEDEQEYLNSLSEPSTPVEDEDTSEEDAEEESGPEPEVEDDKEKEE